MLFHLNKNNKGIDIMSKKKTTDFRNYINKTQFFIEEYVVNKNRLNDKLINYILSIQMIESEIIKSLFNARKQYKKQRDYCNSKIRKLKRKKIKDEELWSYLVQENRTLQHPTVNSEISHSIELTQQSIEELDYKINNLNELIEEGILNIDEENEFIEQQRNLEIIRQQKTDIIIDLKKKLAKRLASSAYYKNQKRIENIELNLKTSYNSLDKLYLERLTTHKHLLDLYRKTKDFDKIKKNLEKELILNKNAAERNYMLFSQLMNQNKIDLLEELSTPLKSEVKPKKVLTPEMKSIIEKKKSHKKFVQERLALLRAKQKSGEKLDFYELKLILDHSKE